VPEPHNRNSLHTDSLSGTAIQVETVHGGIHIEHNTPNSDDQYADIWEQLIAKSRVWHHVPPDRDMTHFLGASRDAAVILAGLRDSAVAELSDDPWYEPDFAIRFVGNVDWLVGDPQEKRLDLYPAEAALLLLLPLLYQVHHLQVAARLSTISPWSLAPSASTPPRAAFETFSERYAILLKRTTIVPSAEKSIGWWIFHRWLIHHDDFDAIVGVQFGEALAPIFEPTRISRLLHGLRRGPGVCNPEYLSTLHPDDNVRRAGNQRIREQRIALLLTLALGVSVEMSALPDIVAEHLAVPDPVHLDQLRETLAASDWTGSHHAPALRARCHHASVIEGLREHTARADELLHTIHRTVRERITHPMPELPVRLSAHEVVPADGVFTGWASFRLDEHRIREMLMGEELYKDRDLAVRELYQNALDACRYRRARTEYINRTRNASFQYEGSIIISQSVDEDGRAYLECRDDGIGMGEAELRGVFSKAGARFAEEPDYKLERAEWQRLDPPVELFPNSRFGIGVLSYFMLAEEIQVTTCRMDTEGQTGPELQASIFGPGHLFRIKQTSARGERIGTTVRFYLKDNSPEWSVVSVLERLLGIAEFLTHAVHDTRETIWEPGRLRPRETRNTDEFGLHAGGTLVEWPGAPSGVSVTWCGVGGAILVDGLVVQPATYRGVLSTPPTGLFGAVVNLSGRHAPERLSVDRRNILDDISGKVSELLNLAANASLAADESLFSVEWICRVADENSPVADLLAETAMLRTRKLHCGHREVDVPRTGFLSLDMKFATWSPNWEIISQKYYSPKKSNSKARMPDHILLWRLLAHQPSRDLDKLTEICPELHNVKPTRPARPSDYDLLFSAEWNGQTGNWYGPANSRIERLVRFGEKNGLTVRQICDRLAALGVTSLAILEAYDKPISRASLYAFCEDDEFIAPGHQATTNGIIRAAQRGKATVADIAELWRQHDVHISNEVLAVAEAAHEDQLLVANLRNDKNQRTIWLEPTEAVPPGHLVRLSIDMGMNVSDVCDRLGRYGFAVDMCGLPETPSEEVATVLSRHQDGEWPWLRRSELVPPACLIESATVLDIDLNQTCDLFQEFGFTTGRFPEDAGPKDLDILWGEHDEEPLSLSKPLPYYHVLDSGMSPKETAARLNEYGFNVPFNPPGRSGSRDKELFALSGPIDWYGESTSGVFPFAKAVLAAAQLNIKPSAVAARLAAYGIPTSCHELPRGLSFHKALQLIDPYREEEYGLKQDYTPTLSELLELSRELAMPTARLVGWLKELGLPVLDVAEQIREALKKVPFAD
jgi:hypothetical protein